jgi:hypothetical protein
LYSSAIHTTMYSFGGPRVGNSAFAQIFDRVIPDGFRVVVDGDIVSSVPYSNAGYKHVIICFLKSILLKLSPLSFTFLQVGTEALIDPSGAGSIVIDSSFIERRLRNKSKSSVAPCIMNKLIDLSLHT